MSMEINVLREGDAGFADAAAVWNGFCSRAVWGVAVCSSANDVANAVQFARAKQLPIAVKGGGHNVAGLSQGVQDGSLVISLEKMKQITVDVERKRCVAQGGCTGAQVDSATGKHDLYVAGLGLISTTGIGGLATGGGVGWLARKYGLCIDSIVGIDIVTANGEIISDVNQTNHPDLFFGVRGGGGNFGIVTAFQFKLVHVPFVVVRYLSFDSGHLKAMKTYGELLGTLPDKFTALGFLSSEDNLLERFLVVMCLIPDEGEKDMEGAIAQITDASKTLKGASWEQTDVLPLHELQQKFDEGNRAGRRYYWKSQFVPSLQSFDAVSAAAVAAVTQKDTPKQGCSVEFVHFGGQISRLANGCFAHRDVAFEMHSICVWDSKDGDESRIAWSRSFGEKISAALKADDLPGNVNILGPGQKSEAVTRRAYGKHFDRLREIKRKYDPDNVFRANHNIAPQ